MARPNIKPFHIQIPECNFMAVSWASTPEKALKDALKIAFDRRGIKCFRLDSKEFVSVTAFANYLEKTGRVDTCVKEMKQK